MARQRLAVRELVELPFRESETHADCVCRRARRLVIAHDNRGTGNRSAVRNVAEDVASQFAEPKSDCVQVESFEDIPMCFEEC